MAFPIHPSRSDFDLMYSVLYDDFTAENAIKVIQELDKEVPFTVPPPSTYSVIVTYEATAGGTLQGALKEWVPAGEPPRAVPTFEVELGYEFSHWSVDGEEVDPETYEVFADTKFVAEFHYIGIFYDIKFNVSGNGHLDGELTAHVKRNDPVPFPNPIPDEEYEFGGWYRGTASVNADEETALGNYTYTAYFNRILKTFTIDTYDVAPRTTSTGASGVTSSQHQITEGDKCQTSWFNVTQGPVIDKDGNYVANFGNEVPTENAWYQRVDSSETISTSTNYFRKTFYAGRGGVLTRNNSNVYSYTAQARTTTGSVTAPTPTPNSGWYFKHWIDLSDGAIVDSPTSTKTTGKYVAVFVES